METRTPGIYAIEHIQTSRRYIGRSVCISKRWAEHRVKLRKGVHHCPSLQLAWKQDGEEKFRFVVLDVIENHAEMIQRELSLLIQHGDSLYNTVTSAASGPRPGTIQRSVEQIEHMRRVNTGRVRSLETRARISAARRGTKCPAHSAALKGYKHSEEAKRNMGISHIGRKNSPETRAKLSAKLKGRVFTPEWKVNLSAGRTGVSWARFYGDEHDFFELVESA